MAHSSSGAESARVLYVNDDAAFADLVRAKIDRLSADLSLATEGDIERALDRLSTGEFDCVVTAYSLSGTTGIEFAERVHDSDADVPTVLFTGQGSERVASRAMRADVSEYVPIRNTEESFEVLVGRIDSLVTAARERRRAERLEARLERTLERTTDAVYAVDDEWRIEYMNDRMAERVGRDPDAVVGEVLWEEFPTIVGTEFEATYRTAMESGDPVSFERYLDDPFDYWVSVRVFPSEDGLTVFSREVSDERERQHELARSEAILERIHDVVFVIDDAQRVQFANDAAARVLGAGRTDHIEGAHLESLAAERVDPDDGAAFTAAVAETLATDRTEPAPDGFYDTDLQVTLAGDGTPLTFDVRLTPFEAGDQRQVLVVARDVTEESGARRQLERERDAFETVQRVIADEALSLDDRLERLLTVGCQVLELDVGIVSNVEDTVYTVRAAHAPGVDITAGDRYDLADTYCQGVVDADGIRAFADAEQAGNATHPAYRESGLASYIGVPVVVDGDRYGTVNFSSQRPREAPFGRFEQTFVRLLARWLGTVLARHREYERAEATRTRLRRIIDTIPQQVFVKDADGRYTLANESAAAFYGVSVPELEGATDERFAVESHAREFRTDDRRVIESGESIHIGSDRFTGPDGAERIARTDIVPLESPAGSREALVVTTDITERERRERALTRYEAIVENMGAGALVVDGDRRIEYVNDRIERRTPGSIDTLVGRSVVSLAERLTTGQNLDDLQSTLDAVLAGESVEQNRIELVVQHPSGQQHVEYTISPLGDEADGKAIIVVRNITQSKARRQALQETKAFLKQTQEAASIGGWRVDLEHETLQWTDEVYRIHDLPVDSDVALDEAITYYHPDDRPTIEAAFDRLRSDAEPYDRELRLVTASEEVRWVRARGVPQTDEYGTVTGAIGVFQDITEQKRIELHLRSLQETARELSLATSTEAIGDIAVEAANEILGLKLTGAWEYDSRRDALVPVATSDAASEIIDDVPTFTGGDSLAWEVFQSGERRVYDDVSTNEGRYNESTAIKSEILVPLGDYGLMSTGSTAPQEFSDVDIDLFQVLGRAVEAAMARADREAQLRRQNQRLDEFASVVAHDLRNPLGVAIGFTDIVQETDEPAHFEKVENAHDRIERLIDDLLTLARGDATVENPSPIALQSVATEAWGYVDTSDATLTVADVPTLPGDSSRLIQLFENLFRNALEHGGHDVTVTVDTLPDREGFYVEDDGAGIPPEKRADVFDHGVTTNEDGTGFGLSIVADIARAHDWVVSATEGTDGGARFVFETDSSSQPS